MNEGNLIQNVVNEVTGLKVQFAEFKGESNVKLENIIKTVQETNENLKTMNNELTKLKESNISLQQVVKLHEERLDDHDKQIKNHDSLLVKFTFIASMGGSIFALIAPKIWEFVVKQMV